MIGLIRSARRGYRLLKRLVLLTWVALAIAAAAWAAPRAARELDVFRVRQVEVYGTRWVAPHDVLAASGIDSSASVFDDRDAWRRRVESLDLVASAGVERRLPGVIIVTVREVEPVALARTPELRPVDGAGRLLPLEPAGMDVDLPVLGVASAVDDGVLADAGALRLARVAATLRAAEPALAARVSELLPDDDGGIRLLLREPADADALLPAGAGPLHLAQLRLALADLSRRGELARVRRIDLRWREQVVVSFTPSYAS